MLSQKNKQQNHRTRTAQFVCKGKFSTASLTNWLGSSEVCPRTVHRSLTLSIFAAGGEGKRGKLFTLSIASKFH